MNGEQGMPLFETDRRYLRNRSLNRHVRKARRARTIVRWTGIVAVNLSVAGVIVAAGWSALRHLTTSDRFAVHTIEVEGAQRTTPDAVRAALTRWMGANLFEIDLDDVAVAARNDPWVAQAAVKRLVPGTLRVTVTERTPAAVALAKGIAHVVAGDGSVMGPAGPGLAFDLPVITGLDGLGDGALSDALARGVATLRALEQAAPSIVRDISEIDLSRPDRVGVTTITRGPRILLDPERVDRNVETWILLREEMTRRLGGIDTVDLRWDRRIAVKPSDVETHSP